MGGVSSGEQYSLACERFNRRSACPQGWDREHSAPRIFIFISQTWLDIEGVPAFLPCCVYGYGSVALKHARMTGFQGNSGPVGQDDPVAVEPEPSVLLPACDHLHSLNPARLQWSEEWHVWLSCPCPVHPWYSRLRFKCLPGV